MTDEALPPGVARCVGAFRRVCFILTDSILCDACWAEVARVPRRQHRGIANRPRPVPDPLAHLYPGEVRSTGGFVRVPFRGDVE